MTMQKVACPTTMVQKPGSMPALLIAESSAMPVMMPGSAIGSTSSTVMLSLPRKLPRAMPSAVREPSKIASRVATAATASDKRIAAQMSSRANAALNQCSVRPGGGNSYVRSAVVSAYSTITSTGRCMKARPAYAARRAPNDGRFQRCGRRVSLGRSEGIEGSGALGDGEIDHDQHDRDHREGGGERNVSCRALLLVHHHADEVARSAHDARNDVVAQRKREREDGPCREARQRER